MNQSEFAKCERTMKKLCTGALLFGVTLATFPLATQAQQVHPQKKIFRDVASWTATAPGNKTKLKNFAPFRAVYDRTYKQHSGKNAGDLRNDRVIISAEEAGWDGKPAVSITIIDSGIVEHSDTNARALTMFVNRDDLSVLFETGPIPGKAKDYYIARVNKNTIKVSQITTDAQKLAPKTIKTNKPGFGPAAWAMASMKLRKGLKINLSPNLGSGNALTSANYGHVVNEGKKFVDGSGKEYQSWVVESSRNLATPRVSHIYLIDKPPYYLGTETVDLETGERKPFVWLRNFQLLDQ